MNAEARDSHLILGCGHVSRLRGSVRGRESTAQRCGLGYRDDRGRGESVGGGSAAAHEAQRSGKPEPHRFLSWDAPNRVAHLTLLAGLGSANNGFNFDGYGRGELLVTIPLGWRVVVDCENRGSARHSCAVVKGSLSITPAFPGAASPAPITGLAPAGRQRSRFGPAGVGGYRIACLVPGHEQARQWDVLDVRRARTPSISARAGP